MGVLNVDAILFPVQSCYLTMYGWVLPAKGPATLAIIGSPYLLLSHHCLFITSALFFNFMISPPVMASCVYFGLTLHLSLNAGSLEVKVHCSLGAEWGSQQRSGVFCLRELQTATALRLHLCLRKHRSSALQCRVFHCDTSLALTLLKYEIGR